MPATCRACRAKESARDLVRAREDARADLMRARHRLSKLLLRRGIVYYGGNAWTDLHERWLRSQRFEAAGVATAFTEDFDNVLATAARRDRLDKAILEAAKARDGRRWSLACRACGASGR